MKNKETKVVIFGDYDTGKTTTLEQLCDKITKVEYKGTTLALDYGNCIVNGEKIHLFATPGHESSSSCLRSSPMALMPP